MVPSSFTRKFLIIFAFLVCIFYLAYRALFTFNTTGPYAYGASLALYIAECFGIFNLFLFFLQVWEVKEPPAQPVLEGRSVDVFVPTFNEDPALLRATLEACVRMDYPHKTYVLDDGRRPEVEALARELGINYISRPDNRHFKAGNLNYAFERTDGEFVVVLDADHVPEPHFITRLIGYFRDDRLGYVQTPHAFYNFDAFQARLDHKNRKYWEEGHLFYYVIQPGRNHWGCPIFAGSAAMFRRSAIRDVGLMATETITEDMHTGLRMNAKGWRSLAISDRLVAGQAAPDITTFHAQRMRWGTGNLSIFKYDNPLFLRGLTLPQRLCYLGSMLHWASGIFKLIIYLTPIAMLFSGIPPVKEFTPELIGVTIIYLIVSLTAMKLVSNGYGSIINTELFSMVNFWTQIKSTFRAILGYGSRQFNVTPKGAAAAEARRKRGVWPFIRPQTYLIILSVLALFWGWGKLTTDPTVLFRKYPVLKDIPVLSSILEALPRIGFGVSDDYFKPVVPTVWVLINFWLAYKVTQRAFWPADRRTTTRHQVHVPVEYDTAAGAGVPRYGVTVDLNDTGMAFVAYERFSPGDVLRFTIRGAGEVIKCKGEIRTVADLTRGQTADGYRYGVQFQNLTSPQVDALNRICLHYGVPRMFGEYDQTRGGLLGGLQKRIDRGMAQRRGEVRNPYRLPIVINSGVTEDTAQFSATEDLSRSAVAALFDNELPRNTPVGYLIASPLGEVRGTARVIRSSPEVYAGRTYFRTVLEFNEFEGQGRTTLHTLVNPDEVGQLKDALKPDRKPILVQMAGATLVALAIAIPLIALQGWFFSYTHRDDTILRGIAVRAERKEPLTDHDRNEVQRIYEATINDKNATSDRLVLLMDALKVFDRRQDQLIVAKELAGRNTDDLTLQQTLIYAQIGAKNYAEAEATYEHLRGLKDLGRRLTTEQIWQLHLSGARVAEGAGDLNLAIQRYKEIYEKNPNYTPENEPGAKPIRKEYAGVLLKAGASDPSNYDRAKEVLQTAPADDIEARRMLAAAYLLKGRSIATDPKIQEVRRSELESREYEGAEQVAEALSGYADRKGDAALKDSAEKMRADVQMARKSWESAREIMRRLGGEDLARAEPDVVRRMGQIQLGQRNYAGALNAFSVLLENKARPLSGSERTEVIKGFLDAAANETVIPRDREQQIALEVFNDVQRNALPQIESDPIYLARLGWVLQRLNENEKARVVLDRASKMESENPEIRNQLAFILIKTGQMDQAAEVLRKSNVFRGQETLAGLYMRRGDMDSAIDTLRKMLNEYPVGFRNQDTTVVSPEDYKRIELMLGTALTLNAVKKGGAGTNAFGAAITHYQILDRKYPNDKEIPTALGNAYLWSAGRATNPTDRNEAYASALKQYQKVLESKNWMEGTEGIATRGKVEDSFIDAAASAPSLDAAQTAIARDIAARRLAGPTPGPIAAARLAWVLIKTGDADARKDGLELLRRASEPRPTKEDEIRELAGVFAAAGDYKSSADLLQPLTKTPDEGLKLANLYAGARQWELAKQELRKVADHPEATGDQKRIANRELAKVTAWSGEHADALKLIETIVRQNPDDVEMKIFQAEVNVWMKNLDKALELFLPLVKQYPDNMQVAIGFANAAAKSRDVLSDEAQGQLIRVIERASGPEVKDALLIARAAEALASKLNDPVRARQLALKASALDPKDPIVRREVAYVLANPKIGLFKDADALFVGMELVGEERKQYVFIASQAENYEAARKQARIYLSEQLPGSLKHREARRLLADVLTWKGDYEEALAIYNQLAEGQKADRDLRVEIAQVYRYMSNYPTALQKFGELLGEDFENRQLWIGFIDAASSAPKIDQHKELLLRIHNRFAPEIADPRTLSRLAWIMYRLDEPGRAHPLLNRAVASNPAQPAVRKELAGVLAALDRRAEAIEMLSAPSVLASLDITELLNLADLLTAENQLERAEAELAKVITEASDRKSRVRYAAILLWNEKYPKAKEVLNRLSRDFPEDREIQLLLAQAYLWSKDYTNALRRFTDLVVVRPDPATKQDPLASPEIWRGYVDAAAGYVGESLRDFPRRTIGPLFTTPQRDAIFRAFDYLTTVRDKTLTENKVEMDKLITPGNEKDANFEARRKALQAKHERRMFTLAGSMGRLGLLLGLLGDRDRSSSAFGAALRIDRENRDVWLQYAQTLTALGDDVRAKAVFDWLLSNPAQKLPPPSEVGPKNGNGVK
jgi:cellulose synthase/poly-beta-1,6-N-acetylglucosamine synthase-like glycosyltransferase/thioredoxin-like negative regulator of GroEL